MYEFTCKTFDKTTLSAEAVQEEDALAGGLAFTITKTGFNSCSLTALVSEDEDFTDPTPYPVNSTALKIGDLVPEQTYYVKLQSSITMAYWRQAAIIPFM